MPTDVNHPASEALLYWYSANKRDLPWRTNPAPYAVWLCEIIMQQTRIQQGIGYWHRFLDQYPSVTDLARASESDVLKLWEGLGYYSRARNLHKAAKVVVSRWGGVFPTRAEDLRTLPGVGPYTAAAVASISAGEPVAAVDGNVTRVISRFLGLDEPVDRPAGREAVQRGAEALLSQQRPGDFNQALMDLGGQICTPKSPDCPTCPLRPWCASGSQPALAVRRPVKSPARPVTEVHWDFHWITDGARWILHRRPAPGIWAGLWCLPITESPLPPFPDLIPSPLLTPLPAPAPPVTHLLTHRRIQIRYFGWHLSAPTPSLPDGWQWHTPEQSAARALPRPLVNSHDALTNFLTQI